ncbi:MAG: hypothetical protein IJW09_05770 [Clostridia bacterium]|nr:hypothetical protein [Clostridia bacterium]
MTDKTKRNLRTVGSWGLKGLGVAASIAFPVSAILERFPLVVEGAPSAKGIGFGGVVALIAALVNLRSYIWPPVSKLIKEKVHITTFVATLLLWGIPYLIILGLERIVPLLPDLRNICIAGIAGAGGGMGLNALAKLVKPAKAATTAGGSA